MLVFACLVSASAAAETDLAPAEVIVVTASQEPRPIDRVPASVDVISREDITLRRSQEVADALRNLLGLHLDQPGGRGGRANLYLRGLDPNQTVVMLDGIRLNDPTNNRGGSFDFTAAIGTELSRSGTITIQILPTACGTTGVGCNDGEAVSCLPGSEFGTGAFANRCVPAS